MTPRWATCCIPRSSCSTEAGCTQPSWTPTDLGLLRSWAGIDPAGSGPNSPARLQRFPDSCYWLEVFTGLVEATGVLKQRRATATGVRLSLEHGLGELGLGESIAVNGVCLTVVEFDAARFEVEASEETLRVTSLGNVDIGSMVNLERALKVGDRLGGHLVSGHVDGLARVQRLEPVGDAVRVFLQAPAALRVYIAAKGSVTLDGVSLTVNEVVGELFQIMLIPHTRAVTTLGKLKVGSKVNLEVDLLARYVCHYLSSGDAASGSRAGSNHWEELLKRSGMSET